MSTVKIYKQVGYLRLTNTFLHKIKGVLEIVFPLFFIKL
nr:MAG TPA: hypothetical protein [Caudoviricetes sp.]